MQTNSWIKKSQAINKICESQLPKTSRQGIVYKTTSVNTRSIATQPTNNTAKIKDVVCVEQSFSLTVMSCLMKNNNMLSASVVCVWKWF